jgi:hypothetical protein
MLKQVVLVTTGFQRVNHVYSSAYIELYAITANVKRKAFHHPQKILLVSHAIPKILMKVTRCSVYQQHILYTTNANLTGHFNIAGSFLRLLLTYSLLIKINIRQ